MAARSGDTQGREPNGGPVLVELGPVSLAILTQKGGRNVPVDNRDVETCVEAILEELRDCLRLLRQKAGRIQNPAHLPAVARVMIEAAQKVDASSLTPMAAVAGAVAEAVGLHLMTEGYDRVIVNNGGDVAVFNPAGRDVRMAIGDVEREVAARYVLRVGGLSRFGVATSGFGGRSFTLGIADMVSVIADAPAVADAAATFICNRTWVETDLVTRRRAGEIDPESDIADELVTVGRKEMPREIVFKALGRGLDSAIDLKERGIIRDAVIVLGREMVTTIRGGGTIDLEVVHGD